MGTTLIVTEKPNAALHVAEALSYGRPPRRVNVDGVPFFEVATAADRVLVCSALGHLYVVASKAAGTQSEYPVWDYAWKPKHTVERGRLRQERWINAIAKASKDIDRFVNACDYDLEGSLIGYTILKYACHGADRHAHRMKFSTLTESELRSSYAQTLPSLDFQSVAAGMCRHEVDWLFGINLSRALTQSAYRRSGRYSTLSTGRVQGPTLRFLVEREREIETFVPVPYWTVRAKVKVGDDVFAAEYEVDKLDRQAEAERVVQSSLNKVGVVETLEYNTYDLAPPTPFDLSSLQNEAYRHFHLTPRISLSVAERLYLDQLISYPRTSSQKLPASIGYAGIIENLGQLPSYKEDSRRLLGAGRLAPNEGMKDDPAHPAIYPTGVTPKRRLDGQEGKMFDLIVRRFLAAFGAKAVKRSEKATINAGGYHFFLRGSRFIDQGWAALYRPYAKIEDTRLPPLVKGQEVLIHRIELEQRFTQPPPRYNPSTLLRKMEEAEIGTKATRAEIIETLYRRGYVAGQTMVATPLAFRVIEILTKNCPRVVDVAFTKELEAKMENIGLGSDRRERVVAAAIEYLRPVIDVFRFNERAIGEELAAIMFEMREESTTLRVPCPRCSSPLRIVKNPRTKKRFIGCSGKWKRQCTYSLPLPQLGSILLLQKLCPTCGFQLIQVTMKHRRALISCSRCYANNAKTPMPARKTAPIAELQ